MSISIFSLVYLFGAAQAFLLIIGFNLNKPLVSDLKKIATAFLLNIMLVLFYYVIALNGYHAIYPYVDSLGTAAWMALTPFYYLLCLSIHDAKWQLRRQHLWYFIVPFIFIVEGFLTTLGFPIWLHQLIGQPQLYLDLWMFTFFGTGFFFIGKSLFITKHSIKNKVLLGFSYLLLFVLVVFTLLYAWIRINYVVYFELTLLTLFQVLIYLFVYKIYKMIPFKNLFEVPKYPNHNLTKEQLQYFARQLEQVMAEEKPYLDKQLNLNKLATLTGITTNDLSLLFNLYYQSSFYEFVNQYRLRYLEKMILQPSNQQYKIIALAEESGFRSKATFYKVFKKKHQLTPVQFINKHKEEK